MGRARAWDPEGALLGGSGRKGAGWEPPTPSCLPTCAGVVTTRKHDESRKDTETTHHFFTQTHTRLPFWSTSFQSFFCVCLFFFLRNLKLPLEQGCWLGRTLLGWSVLVGSGRFCSRGR